MTNLGELQAAVMDCLWASDIPLPVREIQTRLQPGRKLAYTTVLSVCQLLERKGLLNHERVGRAFLYQPIVSRAAHTAQVMREALSASREQQSALVHFVSHLTPQEAAAVRRTLDADRRQP